MAETSPSPGSQDRGIRLPRWAWILIAISVVLNLLIAGIATSPGQGKRWPIKLAS